MLALEKMEKLFPPQEMTEDLVYRRRKDNSTAVLTDVDIYFALQDIARTLKTRGKTLNDYGLDTLVPMPPTAAK